jgi:hypothetical protein
MEEDEFKIGSTHIKGAVMWVEPIFYDSALKEGCIFLNIPGSALRIWL